MGYTAPEQYLGCRIHLGRRLLPRCRRRFLRRWPAWLLQSACKTREGLFTSGLYRLPGNFAGRRRSKADLALLLTRLQEAAERLQAECSGRVLPKSELNLRISPKPKTGEVPIHVFNLVIRKIFARPEFHRQATTVLSTTRFPKAVGSLAPNAVRPKFHVKSKTSPNSSPNCAPNRLQIVLSAPLYSVENMCTPRFSIRLLTEGL